MKSPEVEEVLNHISEDGKITLKSILNKSTARLPNISPSATNKVLNNGTSQDVTRGGNDGLFISKTTNTSNPDIANKGVASITQFPGIFNPRYSLHPVERFSSTVRIDTRRVIPVRLRATTFNRISLTSFVC